MSANDTSSGNLIAHPDDHHRPSIYEGYSRILVEVSDKIAVVQLNNPKLRNSADRKMMRDLTDFFFTVADDDQVRVVVVTGAGDFFSAGGDLKGLRGRLDEGEFTHRIPEFRTSRFAQAVLGVPQPIIAAVNGDAIGWGTSMALWCDIVIASTKARLGDPHVRFGLSVPQSSPLFQLSVGSQRAKHLLFTGELIDGIKAEQWGLVARAVPPEDVMKEAMDEARLLAGIPPLALRRTKRLLNQYLRREVDLVLELAVALESLCMVTDDHAEALNAFIEKRTPAVTGR
jgi:enoyl-CoA hydratase/carnithine racemase